MPFTYDPTTDLGTVRLLISDITEASAVFEDAEITRFLTLEGDDPYRAAATALITIAGNEVLRLKYVRSQGLELDGPAVGRELRLQAATLRDQASERDGEETFLIAKNADGYDF